MQKYYGSGPARAKILDIQLTTENAELIDFSIFWNLSSHKMSTCNRNILRWKIKLVLCGHGFH
jgi:hypothetical protein